MSTLPARPDLGQLRRQAKDLLRAANDGDEHALARLRAVSVRPSLAAAQLAVAREHGFASWPRLKLEVELRAALTGRSAERLAALLGKHPELVTAQLRNWCDHQMGPTPLGFVAMLRYDPALGRWQDQPGTGTIARMLLRAGAQVDGAPGDSETPLITAASYGDAEVVRMLIEAGADLDATASSTAGGVPGGTALRHAAVFGMTAVVDALVAAGARIGSISEAAAAGDLSGWLRTDTPVDDRIRALVMAADHERLDVVSQLLDAGTPVDAADPWGRQPLHTAAMNGRAAAVALLIQRGADPGCRDGEGRTALERCREHDPGDSAGHAKVQAILESATTTG